MSIARADIYSLGCIFYQLLTGKPPFANEGAGEVIGMHLYVQPEPPSRHALGISPDTEALVMAMLAKDPKGRPQTARELAQAFAAVAHAHGWNTLIGRGVGRRMDRRASRRSRTRRAICRRSRRRCGRTDRESPSQPTTLSGAASQSVAAPPKSKKWPIIAVGRGARDRRWWRRVQRGERQRSQDGTACCRGATDACAVRLRAAPASNAADKPAVVEAPIRRRRRSPK